MTDKETGSAAVEDFVNSFPDRDPERSGHGIAPDGDLPVINRHNRRLRELTREALESLKRRNQSGPVIFERAGALARIRRIDGAAQIEMLNADSLPLLLDESANWIKDDGQRRQNIDPPKNVVTALLTMPEYGLPVLRGIAHAPFFASDGRLVAASGYDVLSGVYLDPSGLPALDPIPEKPAAEHVRMMVEYLTGELLTDFPFASGADRANAIGLMLTPFIRPMVDGPIPLHVIVSPQAGTGKSLLAAIVHIIATGRKPPTGVESFDQGEARKAITALLLEAPPIVLLDNVSRHLISGPFAAALTSANWTDRVLGASRMVTVENRAVWVATGNNLTLSSELRRRAVEIRIDAKMERPEERASFRHPDLMRFTSDQRVAIVQALLTIVRNWIALGRPAPSMRPLGSFEQWSQTVGGVLSAARIEGFLGNAEAFRERADPEGRNWRRFVEEWAREHQTMPVTASDLRALAEGVLPDVLGTGNEHSQSIRLGKALHRRSDQIFAGWRIEEAECHDADGRMRNGFRLARA
jgi:putative DNA primase/helicase